MIRNRIVSLLALASFAAAPLAAQCMSLQGTFVSDGKTYTFTWDGQEAAVKLGDRELNRQAVPESGAVSLCDEHGQAALRLSRFGAGNVTVQDLPKLPARATLGISVEPPSEALAEHLGLDAKATLLVSGVSEDGPAQQAGVKRSDVLIALDGDAQVDQAALTRVLAAKQPGDTLELTVLRKGAETKLAVVLGREVAAGPWLLQQIAAGHYPLRQASISELLTDRYRTWPGKDADPLLNIYRTNPDTLRGLFSATWPTRPELSTTDTLAEIEKRLAEIESMLARLPAAKSADQAPAKKSNK